MGAFRRTVSGFNPSRNKSIHVKIAYKCIGIRRDSMEAPMKFTPVPKLMFFLDICPYLWLSGLVDYNYACIRYSPQLTYGSNTMGANPGRLPGYSPSKNLSGGDKYCISPPNDEIASLPWNSPTYFKKLFAPLSNTSAHVQCECERKTIQMKEE